MEDWPEHMLHRYGKSYPEQHDPRYAEIEQIMHEVGVRLYQVVPESTLADFTAYCAGAKYHFLININSARQFLISIDKIERLLLPLPEQLVTKAYVDAIVGGRPMLTARWFSIYEPDFFEKLARHLRDVGVLSLTKYWFVMIRLWWNK